MSYIIRDYSVIKTDCGRKLMNSSFALMAIFYSEGGTTLGDPKESPCHELRQTQPLITLLLRERDHAEGKGCDKANAL